MKFRVERGGVARYVQPTELVADDIMKAEGLDRVAAETRLTAFLRSYAEFGEMSPIIPKIRATLG